MFAMSSIASGSFHLVTDCVFLYFGATHVSSLMNFDCVLQINLVM